MDCILTTGGTGIGERDNTPDVTISWCDKLIPGISDFLGNESLKQTKHALLSRAVAGVKGNTLIINIPGSVRGAVFCTKLIVEIIPHALKMVHGEGH